MSGLLAGKVWQSALAPDLKPLTAALADIGNDDGTSIFPSVAYMAWLLGRSERAVQYGLGNLRKMGILVTAKNGRGGRHSTTEYRLIEGKLPTRIPWREVRKGATVSPLSIKNGATLAPLNEKGCNLRHKRVKPIAPEPSLTVREETSLHKKREATDSRFAPIQNHYKAQFSLFAKTLGLAAPWDGSDAKHLADFLRSQPKLSVEQIAGALDVAFRSAVAHPRPWPRMEPGFRFRAFAPRISEFLAATGQAREPLPAKIAVPLLQPEEWTT